MKRSFQLFLVVLATIVAITSARVALVTSGGGIRATLGTVVALKALHDEQNFLGDISQLYGLSGGAWGLGLYSHANGDINKVYAALQAQAKRDKQWGEFKHFSPKTCNEKSGLFADSCHNGWMKSIKENLFGVPVNSPVNIELSKTVKVPGKETQEIGILIDRAEKRGHVVEHTGQCLFKRKELLCNRFKHSVDAIKGVPTKDPTWRSVYHKFQIQDLDVSTAEVQRDTHKNHNQWVPVTSWDWLAWTSSAWAEQGRESGGLVKALPGSIKIKTKGGQQTESFLADSGAICNLPLGALLSRESEQTGKRVHRVIMLDFSDDAKPLESLKACQKVWRESMHWNIDIPSAAEMKPWGFTTKFKLNPLLGIEASLTVDYFRFRGLKIKNLVELYPTINKRLGVPTGPKFYNLEEFDQFIAEYGGWMKKLVTDKTGPFAYLHDTNHPDYDKRQIRQKENAERAKQQKFDARKLKKDRAAALKKEKVLAPPTA